MPSLVPANAKIVEKSSFASTVQNKDIKELISLELPSHLKVLLPSKFKAINAHRARSISQVYPQEYISIKRVGKTGRSMQLFMSPTDVNTNTRCRASSKMTLPWHFLLCCTGHCNFCSSIFLFFPPLLDPVRCP